MWPQVLALLPSLLDKILPDPGAAADAKLKLMELAQSGELAQLNSTTQVAVAQTEVNKIEAASNRLFVAGWRPAVGWICAFAIGFKYIGGPLLVMVAAYLGHAIQLPDVGADDLIVLLGGMLGLGTLRTVEKVKKVA
ncbi:MAG: hypothetical protein DI587_17005 [Variovorax paradoxus]|nr:MAG: hypothetical protein DI583_17005 [Variovorax paradoxus]PZQ08934.1 MAG: hypothetical protein DI587_17005 [Variovorax paradoxus]